MMTKPHSPSRPSQPCESLQDPKALEPYAGLCIEPSEIVQAVTASGTSGDYHLVARNRTATRRPAPLNK
jgi:hypothetical protein